VSILLAEEIEVRYDDSFTLGPISLKLAPRQHTALLGPSGSGKSTLLRALTGQIEPTKGSIVVLGKERRVSKQLLAGFERISFVPQTPSLPAFQYVEVSFQRALAYLPEADQQQETHKYASLFDVVPFLSHKPETLSIGQQQRCALALAFCNSPSIIALDEPFSHQDAWQRQKMLEAVRQASQMAHTTLLLCTHAIDEASYLCKDALYLLQGQCVYQGQLQSLGTINQPEVLALYGWVSQVADGWEHLQRIGRKTKDSHMLSVEACVPHQSGWLLLGQIIALGTKAWAVSAKKAKPGQKVNVQGVPNS
jgi:ABC-type multidrug transport system ATPase subunit